MRLADALSLASVLGILATGVSAQAADDAGALTDISDANVVTTDGTEVGEIEDVMVDAAGNLVVVVEAEDFIESGDEDVVFPLGDLTFQEGNFVTALDQAAIEALPRHDD